MSIQETFARLIIRDNRRTEAEIQADVRQFILDAPFELDDDDLSLVQLESQLGDRRRIDVEVGATVIEVKRDLRSDRIRRDEPPLVCRRLITSCHATISNVLNCA